MSDDNLQIVGPVSELELSQPVVITIEGKRVLIRKTGNKWQAYSLRCPHKGGMMEINDLKNTILACPLHGWMFDLCQGGLETHGHINLEKYTVYVEDDTIKLNMS